MSSVTIPIRTLPNGSDLELPAYATAGAAGMDLRAAVSDTLRLVPGGRALVPTGLALALPDGYEGQIRPRSGLALRGGITVLNAPGTIDSDFRGEIEIILMNHGREPYDIIRGQRIAQLVIAPVTRAEWQRVTDLPATGRGGGGFGSTGT
jgi:dUTP pyrophosphatase